MPKPTASGSTGHRPESRWSRRRCSRSSSSRETPTAPLTRRQSGLGGAVAVYLPFNLGLLFRMGGEKVQEIAEEKSGVVDVRAATIPMSTTRVLLGLLGGRELAMALRGSSGHNWIFAAQMVGKAALLVGGGLAVSIPLAASVNDPLRAEVAAFFGL